MGCSKANAPGDAVKLANDTLKGTSAPPGVGTSYAHAFLALKMNSTVNR
jgi:hypothetical protein